VDVLRHLGRFDLRPRGLSSRFLVGNLLALGVRSEPDVLSLLLGGVDLLKLSLRLLELFLKLLNLLLRLLELLLLRLLEAPPVRLDELLRRFGSCSSIRSSRRPIARSSAWSSLMSS